MRITISVPIAEQQELNLVANHLASEGIVADDLLEGETANFDGDPMAFLTIVTQVVRDLGIGIVAAYMYDICRRPGHKVTIEGKSMDGLTIKEIEVVLRESKAGSTAAD